ncbi:PREDICTED: prokineticin receptor 2-like [Branchiostoma belcheri]|uniref:Prokineticin receptor 2-like n=1 Tax=Branchiostoma belcheri TaxID=7741 RepID=A0A6P4XLJ7_BRABE|nr:PREDICTED: prokineticin receptor 2-like [Branchiostoma belcheri]
MPDTMNSSLSDILSSYDDAQDFENYNHLTRNTSAGSGLSEVVDTPIASKVVLGIIYTSTMIVCGVGNLLLLIVIATYKKMRTITNALIANLALSDFILAVVCIPFIMDYYIVRPDRTWAYGDAFCAVVNYIRMASLYVSTNALLVIAVDRYLVIMSPQIPRMSPRVVALTILAVWVISMLLAVPAAHFSQAVPYVTQGGAFCGQVWKIHHEKSYKAYYLFMLIFEFIIPVLIMCFCYIRIGMRIWFRTIPGHHTQSQQASVQNSKEKVIRLLIVIVGLFILCWLPYYVYAVIRDFFPYVLQLNAHNTTIYFIVEAIGIANSMINTVVYIGMNHNARKFMRKLPKTCYQVYKRRRGRSVEPWNDDLRLAGPGLPNNSSSSRRGQPNSTPRMDFRLADRRRVVRPTQMVATIA